MANETSHLRSVRHWLSVGMGVKRWLLLLVLGASLMGVGLVYLVFLAYRAGWLPPSLLSVLTLGFLPTGWRILLLIAAGALLVVVALLRLGRNLLQPFRLPGDSLAASLYYHSKRSKGPLVVAIGGGTGLPSLLRGLKEFTSNVTAIVTVADDGGSSGRLRQELGVLPPGDFRNNIAALSQDEALMTQLLQYRFGGSVGGNGRAEVRGHAFGNLLLAALAGVTGSFDEALLAAERVLAMRGRVLPSTLEQVNLVARVQVGEESDTRRVVGESSISHAGGRIRQITLEPVGVRAYPAAVQAILQADVVVMGPGSLYTSILPNLLVDGIVDAVRHTRALRIYVCNLATQPGETDHFSLADHVDALTHYIGGESIDLVIGNDNLSLAGTPGSRTIFVEPSWPPRESGSPQLLLADLVDEARPWRHDSRKLGSVVKSVLEGGGDGYVARS